MSAPAPEKSCNQLYERIFTGEKPDQVTFRSIGHNIFTALAYPQATAGHTLIVPRECYPRVDRLPQQLAQKVAFVSKATGIWLQAAFEPEYVGELVAGNQIAHAHVHRAPCYEGQDWLKVLANPGEKLHPVMSEDQSAEVFSRATLPLEYGMAVELGLSNLHTSGPGASVTNELWTMAKDLAPTYAR